MTPVWRTRPAGAVRFTVLPRYNGEEEWRLHFGRDAAAPEVSVTLGPNTLLDREDEAAPGWRPRGFTELYGFKRADLRPTVRVMATLACEVAKSFGGVVVLDGDDKYATAEEYGRMMEEPGFQMSGFPAV